MTTYPCPVCGAPADLAEGCGGCGRAPDPEAAEVVRLNAELAALAPRVRAALEAYNTLAGEFRATRWRRDELALRVRKAAAPPPVERATAPAPVRPEARPVTVQNLLFVLGGLLVGAAAVVFTGVAWATYGAVGRSVALAVVTLLALAVPPLAARRGLRGTAETFAALAMLLVVLDGYGAWYVNLLGLGAVSGAGYAAGVCAVTAAVGVAYGLATRLSAPRFAALVAVQPVAPLLAASFGWGVRGWAVAFAVAAAVNLAVVRLAGREPRVAAWVLFGGAQVLSGVCALLALLEPGRLAWPVLAGAPALVAAATLVAAAWLARSAPLRTVAEVVAALAVGGAVVRPVAELAPSLLLVASAVTVLALGLAVHIGLSRFGALAGAALLAPFALTMATVDGAASVAASLPVWRGGSGTGPPFDWQVPVAVALLTVAVALAAPARWRWGIAAAGGAVAVLGTPAPWWALLPAELAAAALLTLVLARRTPVVAGTAAAALAGHALLVSLVRPWAATAALGTLVAIGALSAFSGVRADGRANVVTRAAFGVGLVALPGAAACAVFAAGAPDPWPARAGLAVAALLLLPVVVLAGRPARPYAVAALAVAVTVAALWPDLAGGDPTGLYPALGLLVLAAAHRAVGTSGRVPLAAASALNALALLVVAVPVAYGLFVEPYRWLGDVWTGVPSRVAVDLPGGGPPAVLLVAAALALVGRWRAAVLTGLVGAVAVAAAAGVPWPVVPGAVLALGTGVVLASVFRGGGGLWGVPMGVVMAAPGLAGLLPTEAATLAGLGFVVVASAATGAGGATGAARVGGWLVASAAGGALAVASTLAAGQPLGYAAYPLLAVGAAALGLAVFRRRFAVPERLALDAAAHGVAVVALLVAFGDTRRAAAVCTLWAAAVAARAVAPGETARRRLALAAAGCATLAWWLLLAGEEVAVAEAYTLPAALFALAAGHLALRARPAFGSWVGYGPGLAAALLPSLASILVADGQGVRRLLLGLGALLVVLAGAYERRQAPLVAGGSVLLAVALHEVLVWDVLPRWAYLALGGLVLIAVAMTYERRLRDLRRLRGAIARMT